jgi:hypothetical protein
VGLIVLAILALLAALAARVDAAPADDDDNDDDTLSGVGAPVSVPAPAPIIDPPAPAIPIPVARITPPIPVHDVIDAAYRAAGVADDPAPGWRLRSRLGGLVPWVTARVGRGLTWREVDDPTLGYNEVWDARATWHLDRLVFEPNEVRIAAIDVSRRRERRRVAALAIHTYYDWLALDVAARRSAHWATRSDEVLAELDAMTDGWFSRALAKVQKP